MVVAAGRTVDLETRGTRPCRSNNLFDGIVGGVIVGVCRSAVEGKETRRLRTGKGRKTGWERKGMTPKQIPTYPLFRNVAAVPGHGIVSGR